jgi:hypothetical protein
MDSAHSLCVASLQGAAPEARAVAFVPPSLAKFQDMQDLLLLDPIHETDEPGWPARKQ